MNQGIESNYQPYPKLDYFGTQLNLWLKLDDRDMFGFVICLPPDLNLVGQVVNLTKSNFVVIMS